jgi:hypothetical protein
VEMRRLREAAISAGVGFLAGGLVHAWIVLLTINQMVNERAAQVAVLMADDPARTDRGVQLAEGWSTIAAFQRFVRHAIWPLLAYYPLACLAGLLLAIFLRALSPSLSSSEAQVDRWPGQALAHRLLLPWRQGQQLLLGAATIGAGGAALLNTVHLHVTEAQMRRATMGLLGAHIQVHGTAQSLQSLAVTFSLLATVVLFGMCLIRLIAHFDKQG